MKELEEKQKKAQQEEEIIKSNIVKDEHWHTLGIWIPNNQNPDWSEYQTSLQFGNEMCRRRWILAQELDCDLSDKRQSSHFLGHLEAAIWQHCSHKQFQVAPVPFQ